MLGGRRAQDLPRLAQEPLETAGVSAAALGASPLSSILSHWQPLPFTSGEETGSAFSLSVKLHLRWVLFRSGMFVRVVHCLRNGGTTEMQNSPGFVQRLGVGWWHLWSLRTVMNFPETQNRPSEHRFEWSKLVVHCFAIF